MCERTKIEGCPDDGPSMVVDKQAQCTSSGRPLLLNAEDPSRLFHAMTRDGRTFTRASGFQPKGGPIISTRSIRRNTGRCWDESGTGTRRLASATGRVDSGGRVRFERRGASAQEVGTYPVVASSGTGAWVQAWTSGSPDSSVVRVSPLE